MYRPKVLFDHHVHTVCAEGLDKFILSAKKFIEQEGSDGVNLFATRGFDEKLAGITAGPILLYLKAIDPRFTAFGSFFYWIKGMGYDSDGLAEQLSDMMEAGFDGLKMLEGKPTFHSQLKIPMYDERYDKAMSLAEKTGYNVLMHINDPEEFWDPEKCPEWANHHTGGYFDMTKYLTKDGYYEELEKLLAKHLKLNMTVAHAVFYSNFPERLDKFFTDFPCVSMDLTPGIEMYDGFTKQRERWRELFIKYQDRITLGTDSAVVPDNMIQPIDHDGSVVVKVNNIIRFLATDDKFTGWGYDLQGLKLPPEVVQKICADNFLRLKGPDRPIVPAKAAAYTEKLYKLVENDSRVDDFNRGELKKIISLFEKM